MKALYSTCAFTLLGATLWANAASAQSPEPPAAAPPAAAPPAAAPPAAAPPVQAAEPAQKPAPSAADIKQAKSDLGEGQKLMKAKDFEAALPKLRSSYAVDPKASTLKSVADCERETGHLASAYATYQAALDSTQKPLTKKEKVDVDKAMTELLQRTGTIAIGAVQPGTSLKVDHEEVSADRMNKPFRLDVGPHTVEATLQGFEPFSAQIEVKAAEESTVAIQLRPEIKTGHVKVIEPSGKPAHVLVDGKDVGVAPWEGDLEPGHHVITLAGDKLTSQATPIDVAIRSSAELSILAVAAPPPPPPTGAKYAFTVTPATATLKVNGQPLPTLAGELAPGTYQLVIAAPGYQTVTKTVTLVVAQPYAESVRLEPLAAGGSAVKFGGLIGIIALPRPIELELGVKIKDTLGIGFQYSMIPTITFPGKDAEIEMSAYQGIVRWFPFQGGFYLGAGVGVQIFKASLSSTVGSGSTSGTLTTTADASVAFVAPQLGWLWTTKSGFTLGLNLGVQIPVSSPPGTSSTIDGETVPSSCSSSAVSAGRCDPDIVDTANSSADDIDSVVKIIAKTPIPTIDLLKLGFFF